MQKRRSSVTAINRLSYRLLFLGTYAVLCQLTLILLYVCVMPDDISHDVLRHTVLPWLEYPLMSLALILGGATLLNWVER